jgi:hypothetical protein
MVRLKIEIADIDGYDWDWFSKYGGDVTDELLRAYSAAFILESPTTPPATVQAIAAEWATEHTGSFISGAVDSTKERVRAIVSETVAQGESVRTAASQIRDDYIFSKDRATTVARTETAKALGQGQKGAAIAQNRNEKRWTTQGDALVRPSHLTNASVGWIPISDVFPSGEDTIEAPNCRCVVRYRTGELHDVIASFRCDGCNRLLGKEVHCGTRIVCRSCKIEKIA